MVNYLSHYGISRKEGDAVSLHHSWESANKVTNWFIFNAGKHSEHHTKPTRPHFKLKLGETSEKLPFGLLLLTVIALVPPLYFAIMNPMVDRREADRDHDRASDIQLRGELRQAAVVEIKLIGK
jgi:alkane 1-monooxygenase